MIYFISNGEHIKIGQTTDSENTLLQLQEGSDKILSLVHELEGGIERETNCHFIWNAYRVLGTWYKLPDGFKELDEDHIDAEMVAKCLFEEEESESKGIDFATNTNLITRHGFRKALVIEHLFMRIPRDSKAKINVIELSRLLPISPSTAQRTVKELCEQEGYLIKHSRTEYSFSTVFFDNFPEFKNKIIL